MPGTGGAPIGGEPAGGVPTGAGASGGGGGVEELLPFGEPLARALGGISIGGLSLGVRLPNPVNVLCGGRLRTGLRMRSRSSLASVSFSTSSSTIESSTSRYWTRISQASSCAASIRSRTSESMSAAMSSE